MKLKELIDSGTYTCHAKFDTNNDFDKHFPIYVDCELKKCHRLASIQLNEMPAIATDDTDATNLVNEYVTAISKPQLTYTASKSMVNRTGDGRTSLQKRHISFDSSSTFTTTSSPSSVRSSSTSIYSSINQHTDNLLDIALSTAIVQPMTTVRPTDDDIRLGMRFRKSSNRWIRPTGSYPQKRRG